MFFSPISGTTKHKYHYSPLSEEVYVQEKGSIIQHFVTTTNQKKVAIIKDTKDYCSKISVDCTPITKLQDNTLQINFAHKIVQPLQKIYKTMHYYFMSRPSSIKTLIKYYTLFSLDSLLDLLIKKTPFIMSTD